MVVVFEQWTEVELDAERRRLVGALAGLSDFTPASLHEEWRRCGKSSCRCAKPGDPGHGPRHILVRRQEGRVVTRQVPALWWLSSSNGRAGGRSSSRCVAGWRR